MKAIAKFYTYFWVVYFPVCIAFAYTINFDWSDEILTILLLVYALAKKKYLVKNHARVVEIKVYLGLMFFYLIYSLMLHVTTSKGVMLDFLQQLRPYAVFFLTWMMAPQFTIMQKKYIKWVMLLSFGGYLFAFKFSPELVTQYVGGESAALGQIALCCAIIYYLFSKQTKQNRNIAIIIMLLGLISGKSK